MTCVTPIMKLLLRAHQMTHIHSFSSYSLLLAVSVLKLQDHIIPSPWPHEWAGWASHEAALYMNSTPVGLLEEWVDSVVIRMNEGNNVSSVLIFLINYLPQLCFAHLSSYPGTAFSQKVTSCFVFWLQQCLAANPRWHSTAILLNSLYLELEHLFNYSICFMYFPQF